MCLGSRAGAPAAGSGQQGRPVVNRNLDVDRRRHRPVLGHSQTYTRQKRRRRVIPNHRRRMSQAASAALFRRQPGTMPEAGAKEGCGETIRRDGRRCRLVPVMSGNGALGKRFDAYPWRHPVTESSYINSLANRPYRSTVKTLPATLPEPWTTVRGPRSEQQGPWTTDLEPRIVGLGSSFAAPSSWTPNRGY